jgi:hypothetical protein
MEKDWIRIFTSRDFYKSEIVKQALTEHNIETVLINKQDSSYHAFGEIELYIHQENFSNAIEVLNQI